ncbi:MAG: hypothetical protein J0G99_00405 [Alphaproteobacteria bacterium]|nr:hypothetical protein [Alphaproteobacteria bacterium]
MPDNRPPPDPNILELARVIARWMARENYDRRLKQQSGSDGYAAFLEETANKED